MAAQLHFFESALFFQDAAEMAAEQRRVEETPLAMILHEQVPAAQSSAVPASKREQNRISARKMRDRQRINKEKEEKMIQMIKDENRKLELEGSQLMLEIKELRSFIESTGLAETAVELLETPLLVKPVVSDSAAAVVVVPRQDIVQPPPMLPQPAVPCDLNVPFLLFEQPGHAAQLPTQVEPRCDKNSKLVAQDESPVMESHFDLNLLDLDPALKLDENCCREAFEELKELSELSNDPELSQIVDTVIALTNSGDYVQDMSPAEAGLTPQADFSFPASNACIPDLQTKLAAGQTHQMDFGNDAFYLGDLSNFSAQPPAFSDPFANNAKLSTAAYGSPSDFSMPAFHSPLDSASGFYQSDLNTNAYSFGEPNLMFGHGSAMDIFKWA